MAEGRVEKSDGGMRIVGGRRAISRRLRGLCLDYVGVGGQRFWALGATSAGLVLGHVAVPGFADYFRFVFLEYARHQPWHLHWRLRTQIMPYTSLDYFIARMRFKAAYPHIGKGA